MAPSKVLIIGATGYIGRHITRASIAAGHPTYVFRANTISNPEKEELVEFFRALGATILNGSLEDHESLVASIRNVDVVISTVGLAAVADQTKIVAAIQEAGTIKRFLPSEFGMDIDRDINKVLKLYLGEKIKVRRAVEESGIPYTFITCNCTFGYFLDNLTQTGLGYTSPPRDKVVIYGDGNAKAVYVAEEDVGAYTIKALDDPRTLNKIVYIRPPANILSQNELMALWEEKIGKTLEKTIQSEEEIVKQMDEIPYPENRFPAFRHAFFLQGIAMCEIRPDGADAAELYKEVEYTRVEGHLDQFV